MNAVYRAYLWGRALRIRWVRRSRGDLEYNLLPMLLRPGTDSIDVGANRGLYTFPMSERSRHVWAYEPNPWVSASLARGAPANVTVKNVAVSDTACTVTLRVPVRKDGSLAHNQGSIERYAEAGTVEAVVPAVRLDDEGLQNVGFIKIDAEDHEIPVVRGARALIMRDRPNLLIEVLDFSDNQRWQPLYDEMKSMGYEGYAMVEGGLVPAITAARHPTGRIGLNILFLPVT
jgi:FkbM family methyltransferase